MKKSLPRLAAVTTCGGLALLLAASTVAGVTLVEPGHALRKIVDTCAPVDPSQTLLDTACALGTIADIESIAINPNSNQLFVQLMDGGDPGTDTCVFRVNRSNGFVALLNPSTGFGGNTRGTDMILERSTGLLLTMDDNTLFSAGAERIATVDSSTGATGTYTPLFPPGIFVGATLGMDFSGGVGGTDVPPADLVFTADVAASGIYSTPSGGPAVPHLVTPAGGDDVVIQPDGDWVWIGDLAAPLIAYSPMPPHAPIPSALTVPGIFAAAGRPFVFGTRATICDGTGEIYLSFSGGVGGSAIFRVDEPLLTATHVADIGPDDGLQDMVVGPSTFAAGGSLYFTVHDIAAGCEQVWEMTLPECEVPLYVELDTFTATLDPEGVRVEWTTTLERDNVGFRVLRQRDGVRQKHPTVMTPAAIPAQGNDLQGASYVWIDRTKQAPGLVHYWLEDVDVNGMVHRHGPVSVELPSETRQDPGYREEPRRTRSR